jgi:hypothetical protein
MAFFGPEFQFNVLATQNVILDLTVFSCAIPGNILEGKAGN